MTRLTYYEQGNEISIELEGHAGAGEKGSDIVCAAISMLAQALISYLNIDHRMFDYSMKDGHVWCYAMGENAPVAFHVILTGFYLIRDNYPECLSIERGCSIQRTPYLVD